MSAGVSLKNFVKGYIHGKQRVEVLHALNLEVQVGEFLALMGPSGCGKTTLIKLIADLDRADDGEAWVAQERIDQLAERQPVRWRARHVGFVFQFCKGALGADSLCNAA